MLLVLLTLQLVWSIGTSAGTGVGTVVLALLRVLPLLLGTRA